MKWHHYLAAFAAGFFFTNCIPHFTQGVTGNAFPTPFSSPQGKGLSAAFTNVLWGCANLFIGYLLMHFSKLTKENKLAMAILFLGICVAGVMLSFSFSKN
jgi:hypothetical protein